MSRTTKGISVLLVLVLGLGVAINRWGLATGLATDLDQLITFHAGSLALPFQQICEEFNKQYPGVKILRQRTEAEFGQEGLAELQGGGREIHRGIG